MKNTANLMRIGVGIELETINGYCFFTDKSLDCFMEYLLNYDFSVYGVSLKSLDGLNVCAIIGCMFDVCNLDRLNINKLKSFLQKKANQVIKEDKPLKRKHIINERNKL